MKKVLIHNNNTSYNRLDYFPVEEQILFTLPSELVDVDMYITQELSTETWKEKLLSADLLFIKVALSENYLEYLGLRLSYHIRLSKFLGAKANTPIVLIAEETVQFLGITTQDPSILFTRGINLITERKDSFKDSLQWYATLKPINGNIFINSITIHPPANYLSHHSIANEWSLLRWSKVLGIPEEHDSLQFAKRNIESLLYYKYLQAKHPADSDLDKEHLRIEGEGKILYIDDEWDKGWKFVLKEFFDLSPGIDFNVLEASFKDKTERTILEECIKATQILEPDTVILDLRLSDADFATDKRPGELTGCQVLRGIKKFNPGIRVIIFTASNKVWNLLELQKEGADGFILKESPEFGAGATNTKTTIKQFSDSIREQLKYKFQKGLFRAWSQIRSFLSLTDTEENEEYKDFIAGLKQQVNIIYSSTRLIDLNNSSTIDIAFLGCFNFMEQFKTYYNRFDNKDYRYYLGLDQIILNRYKIIGNRLVEVGEFVANGTFDSPTWFIVQAALFIDYFKICSATSYKEIIELNLIKEKRNDFIHLKKSEFTIEELNLIMTLLYKASKNIRE